MKIKINKKYTNGHEQEIIVHTINGPDRDYPVIASRCDKGIWIVSQYTENGEYLAHVSTPENLIEVKEKKKLIGFVNVYDGVNPSIHSSSILANTFAAGCETPRIACIDLSKHNIFYEENEGL